MLYLIHATAAKMVKDGPVTRKIPPFYLDSRVVDGLHAAKIAKDIIDPFGELATSITAKEYIVESTMDYFNCADCGRTVETGVNICGRLVCPECDAIYH